MVDYWVLSASLHYSRTPASIFQEPTSLDYSCFKREIERLPRGPSFGTAHRRPPLFSIMARLIASLQLVKQSDERICWRRENHKSSFAKHC